VNSTYRKITLLTIAAGLLVTGIGSALLSQKMQRIGQPMRVGGMVVCLVALSVILFSSIMNRYPENNPRRQVGRAPGTSAGIVIAAARVTAIILVAFSALSLVILTVQLAGSFGRNFGRMGNSWPLFAGNGRDALCLRLGTLASGRHRFGRLRSSCPRSETRYGPT
jgi:hypothetical protein